MTFEPQQVENFRKLFDERKELIRGFGGCMHLELWQDAHASNVFLTYSHWESEKHLDHYRFSELFKDTWAKTKALFSDKPIAWSVMQQVVLS